MLLAASTLDRQAVAMSTTHPLDTEHDLNDPAGARRAIRTGAVTGNTAGDLLFVVDFPILTKEFTDDPVGAGDTVTLEFTITNSSSTSNVTDITFEDIFDTVLPTASSIPADGFCGAGSTATFTPLFDGGTFNTPASLVVSSASLGPAASCTFSLSVHPGAT